MRTEPTGERDCVPQQATTHDLRTNAKPVSHCKDHGVDFTTISAHQNKREHLHPATCCGTQSRSPFFTSVTSGLSVAKSKTLRFLTAALTFLAATTAQADWLQPLDDALFVEFGNVRADFSGTFDLESYYIDQDPPGLIFPTEDYFTNPRLSLFLDTQIGDHFYSLVQMRVDRGFDPGSRPDGDTRLDEYLLRYTPLDDQRLNLQVGKFATVFGGWVPRHLSWDNPFINAPLPYENVTTITDHVVPGGPAGFVGRRNRPDIKQAWLPILWGPAYTSGASIFGTWDRFDYAFEFKNASISSRPYSWDPFRINWDHPTYSGRVGFEPNATWKFGTSFSYGPYLLPVAAGTLPADTGLGEFDQTTIGFDARWAYRNWQVWAEVIGARFEVPNIGNADTYSYFIEAMYKFTPKLYGAARWNQQFFSNVPDGAGGQIHWDRNASRIEAVVGYRFTRHLQVKLQYGFTEQEGDLEQGQQLIAGKLTVKF